LRDFEIITRIYENMGRLFEKGNPGKPKGAITKSTKLVKDVFADAFTELQKDKAVNLIAWGKENPTEFYKIVSRLIPMQVDEIGKATIRISIK